jgi:uncharacterized protein (TIGR04255 family)
MVKRGSPLPKKLKSDAIVEAIFELRFEGLAVPELYYGRMADHPLWKGFTVNDMPFRQLPAAMRVDPNMRYLPALELAAADRTALRLGPYSLAYHHLAPYVGWELFKPRLAKVVDSLFDTAQGITVQRIGLRYLNVLTSSAHRIDSFEDLDIELLDADGPINSNLNINFIRRPSTSTSCAVRIATPEFAQPQLPPGTRVVVDIDVYTEPGFSTNDRAVIGQWTEEAHGYEKSAFFQLLKQSAIDDLTETE